MYSIVGSGGKLRYKGNVMVKELCKTRCIIYSNCYYHEELFPNISDVDCRLNGRLEDWIPQAGQNSTQ
jgi:hypothetical protein